MKIIFTGGHFSPAYSVIQKIIDKHEVIVVGRKHALEGDKGTTLEYEICKEQNIPFLELKTGRLQRKLTAHTLKSFLKTPIGIYNALRILRHEKPDVVVTFGGYIALPVAIASKILKIPVILHEQTQKAGMSAKIISKFSDVVLISFESSRNYFHHKNIILVGNPIREKILMKAKKVENITEPFIYVTGGSTGAHFINELIFSVLPVLIKDFTIIHQTGNSSEFDDYGKGITLKKELNSDLSKKYIVSKFFGEEEVSYFMKNCALVISRSGANTVLEMMAVGVVGILIPLPHGQKNEQRDNAVLYQSTGLGVYMEQDEITIENFISKISDIINNRQKFKSNHEKALKYVHFDAAQRIIEQIEKYGKSSGERDNPS